jgi:hypothetical protein
MGHGGQSPPLLEMPAALNDVKDRQPGSRWDCLLARATSIRVNGESKMIESTIQ